MCNFFNTSQRTFIQVASHSNSKLRKLHWKPNGICVICDFSEIPCVSYYVVSSNGIHSAWYSTDCLEFHQSNISFHSTTFLVLFSITCNPMIIIYIYIRPHLPSITYTMLPTSPSLIIRLFAAYWTGYMQSTISRIWFISKFFMKSLSKIADLISSRDL